MKKLILFLILAVGFSTTSVKAQTILPVNKYIWEYIGVAGDSINATNSTFIKEIQFNKLDGLFYNASVKVADATSGGGCTLTVYEKMFSTDAYTLKNTLTWSGGGTDTTFVITSNTTATFNRYLKFQVEQTAASVLIKHMKLSLKK